MVLPLELPGVWCYYTTECSNKNIETSFRACYEACSSTFRILCLALKSSKRCFYLSHLVGCVSRLKNLSIQPMQIIVVSARVSSEYLGLDH